MCLGGLGRVANNIDFYPCVSVYTYIYIYTVHVYERGRDFVNITNIHSIVNAQRRNCVAVLMGMSKSSFQRLWQDQKKTQSLSPQEITW